MFFFFSPVFFQCFWYFFYKISSQPPEKTALQKVHGRGWTDSLPTERVKAAWKSPKMAVGCSPSSPGHCIIQQSAGATEIWCVNNGTASQAQTNKMLTCFCGGMICSLLRRHVVRVMHYMHPNTNVNVMTDLCFGDTIPCVILSLSRTTSIARRKTSMQRSKIFSKPKETKFLAFTMCFLSVQSRQTADAFWAGQHCLDNTEGLSLTMKNGYFLLVQALGPFPLPSGLYTLSPQEHSKYYVKRQTWGFAYVKCLVRVIFPAENTGASTVLVLVKIPK